MARRKPTEEDLAKREALAAQIKKFAEDNLFTEVKLAETIGVSRRTIQMIKGGKVSPHPGTMRLLLGLFGRYRAEGWKG